MVLMLYGWLKLVRHLYLDCTSLQVFRFVAGMALVQIRHYQIHDFLETEKKNRKKDGLDDLHHCMAAEIIAVE